MCAEGPGSELADDDGPGQAQRAPAVATAAPKVPAHEPEAAEEEREENDCPDQIRGPLARTANVEDVALGFRPRTDPAKRDGPAPDGGRLDPHRQVCPLGMRSL